jgi:hypothetical protein
MLVSGGAAVAGNEPGTDASLAAAIDSLLTLDPDTLDDAELAVALHRQQARLAAATAPLTAALDARPMWAGDGSRSCGAWVAHRCRLPLGQARAGVWLGRRLRAMPVTAEAFATGHIGQRHAAVLASLAGGATAQPPPDADLEERRARLEEFRSKLRAEALRDLSW